jgi:hypothetical protein
MRRPLLAFAPAATAAILLAGCGVRSADDRTRVDEAHKTPACATGDGSLCVGATLPQLAVDSRHGRMLVVWRQQTTPNVTWLTGRLIGSDAHPVGGPRALGRLGSADDRQVTIRYDPRRDRYVIGWAAPRGHARPAPDHDAGRPAAGLREPAPRRGSQRPAGRDRAGPRAFHGHAPGRRRRRGGVRGRRRDLRATGEVARTLHDAERLPERLPERRRLRAVRVRRRR